MWQQIFLILFVECGRYFYFQILCFIVIGFFMIGNHVFPIDLEVTREGQSSTPNKIDGSFKISVESNKRSAIRTIYEKSNQTCTSHWRLPYFFAKSNNLNFKARQPIRNTNSKHTTTNTATKWRTSMQRKRAEHRTLIDRAFPSAFFIWNWKCQYVKPMIFMFTTMVLEVRSRV